MSAWEARQFLQNLNAVLRHQPPWASFSRAGEPSENRIVQVGPALGRLFGIRDLRLDTRLTSLLAFVYTYHYLNWFIKAEVIHWNQMTKRRLALVVARGPPRSTLATPSASAERPDGR